MFISEFEGEKLGKSVSIWRCYGQEYDGKHFFDLQCSIQALIKVRQSYNYTLLNSVIMFL